VPVSCAFCRCDIRGWMGIFLLNQLRRIYQKLVTHIDHFLGSYAKDGRIMG